MCQVLFDCDFLWSSRFFSIIMCKSFYLWSSGLSSFVFVCVFLCGLTVLWPVGTFWKLGGCSNFGSHSICSFPCLCTCVELSLEDWRCFLNLTLSILLVLKLPPQSGNFCLNFAFSLKSSLIVCQICSASLLLRLWFVWSRPLDM